MNWRVAELRSALGAFPNTHRQAAAKKHVQQILHFMSHLESETLADYHVPGTSKLLVHGFLYHLSCTLRKRTMQSDFIFKALTVHSFHLTWFD